MSKKDLQIPDLAALPSETGAPEEYLDGVVRYTRALALDACQWYGRERRWKRTGAKAIRVLVILATAAAGIIPILTEIFRDDPISPAWASVALAVAGTLVLFDRFFGLSTGWLRFTNAMMKIRIAINGFDMDLAAARLAWGREGPDPRMVEEVVGRCRKLIATVNTVVLDETRQWDEEFRDALGKLDEAAARAERNLEKGEPPPRSGAGGAG